MMLTGVRDYLRETNGWKFHQCGIQYRSSPPQLARGFYVALSCSGVQGGPAGNHYLKETYALTLGIWKESGVLPADLVGHAQLNSDEYQKGSETLDSLERKLIDQLHQAQEVRNVVNGKFGLPGSNGGEFLLPFHYDSGGDDELVSPFGGQQGTAAQYLGRRLRFVGFTRNQRIGSIR
jgi:hypothetical protein